jgi:hypothetical protein
MHIDRRGYAYRSERRGGRVCREYLGKGAHLQDIAFLDSYDRAQRDEQRQARRLQRAQVEAQDAEFKAYFDSVSATVRAVLESAGYHLHARSVWRKRRDAMPETIEKTAITKTATKAPKGDAHALLVPSDKAELLGLLKQAQAGDKDAAYQLRKALALPENANVRRNLAKIGDTGEMARQAVAGRIAGTNLLVAEAVEIHIENMSRELAGPCASPLEVLLAERVAFCCARLNQYETIYAQASGQGGMLIDDADHLEARIDQLHKRYLSAIKTLATVRKLQLPTVQINVGEQQVNVGTLNGAPSGQGV